MIICASRRTDIPAFHSRWMMARLREGHCLVRNPVSRTTLHRIDLTRRNVDCIEFMTKDPRPMLPYLKEIGSMGHMYVFQVTLTPYGKSLEPGVAFKADISDACVSISERIGRDRMAWRYDPVLFTSSIDSSYHQRKFDMLCREASQWTDRCIFSFVDVYGKLTGAMNVGLFRTPTESEMDVFCRMASRTAEEYGISLTCCCSKRDLTKYGIEPGGCFDPRLMRSLNIPFESQDVPVRDGCRCAKAVDIGEYDTCGHDCVYCYANRSSPYERRTRLYSEDSELLWGAVMPRDRIVETRSRDAYRLDEFRSRAVPLRILLFHLLQKEAEVRPEFALQPVRIDAGCEAASYGLVGALNERHRVELRFLVSAIEHVVEDPVQFGFGEPLRSHHRVLEQFVVVQRIVFIEMHQQPELEARVGDVRIISGLGAPLEESIHLRGISVLPVSVDDDADAVGPLTVFRQFAYLIFELLAIGLGEQLGYYRNDRDRIFGESFLIQQSIASFQGLGLQFRIRIRHLIAYLFEYQVEGVLSRFQRPHILVQ